MGMFTSYCNFIVGLLGFGSAFLRGKVDERCLTIAIAENKLCRTVPEYCNCVGACLQRRVMTSLEHTFTLG